MATFNSPKTRLVNLALYSDGSWKIISDEPIADVAERVAVAASSISSYAARVASGEPEEPDTDDEPVTGVTVTTLGASAGQL